MRTKFVLFGLIFSLILLSSLASAQFGGGGYGGRSSGFIYGYGGPFDGLFQSDLFVFAIIFILFFGIVFYSIGKGFKDNKSIAILISVVVALLITVPLVNQGFLQSWFSGSINDFVFFVAIVLIILVLVKSAFTGKMGLRGLFISLLLIWIVLWIFNPYSFVPYGPLGDTILFLLGLFMSLPVLLLLIVGLFISIWTRDKSGGRNSGITINSR